MKLTIIPIDNIVIIDGDNSHHPLSLGECDIPINVHALQWYDTYGFVEYKNNNHLAEKQPNENISVLPTWAVKCAEVWGLWTPPSVSNVSVIENLEAPPRGIFYQESNTSDNAVIVESL
jgi:hypothetical protein